jgi:hypothetical protein
MRRILLTTALCSSLTSFLFMGAPTPAFAAEVVSVRASTPAVEGSNTQSYTRIVFEWPTPPSYLVQKSDQQIIIDFQKDGNFKIEGQSPQSVKRISGYKVLDKNSVQISFAQGLDVRDFAIGNRVIIDIRGEAKKEEPKKEEPKKEEPKKEEPKKEEPKKEEPKKEELKTKTPDENPDEKIVSQDVKAEEPKSDVKAENTLPQSSLFELRSTQNIASAIFAYQNELLWLVNQPDLAIPPVAATSQPENKKSVLDFRPFALDQGTGFRTQKDNSFPFVYAEGGNLSWRLLLTNQRRDLKPLSFQRVEQEEGQKKLLWPLKPEDGHLRSLLQMNDPISGMPLYILTTSQSQFFAVPQDFVEITVLPSSVGLAFISKVDDLVVKLSEQGLEISRPSGLALSQESDLIPTASSMDAPNSNKAPLDNVPDAPVQTSETDAEKMNAAPIGPLRRIFDFERWALGGPKSLDDNRTILMTRASEKEEQDRLPELLSLARLELANGNGVEATGYLDYAQDIDETLQSDPEFIALKVAALALARQFSPAFAQLQKDEVAGFTELSLWRSYVLAGLEDWQQAADVLPMDTSLLQSYPVPIRQDMLLTLAEVALRDGRTEIADPLLEQVAQTQSRLPLPVATSYAYLQGESQRQKDNIKQALEEWTPLSQSRDDYNRAKAGLALTVLQLTNEDIKIEEAIDRLEGLRYAWRGDELETSIAFELGKLYAQTKDFLKAFSLLRQAASLAPEGVPAQDITAFMSDEFKKIFAPETLKDVSPVDAITLYNEFSELIPSGEEGYALSRRLADHLVQADLIERAGGLLQQQLASGALTGVQAADTAIELASIQLDNTQAEEALKSLDQAQLNLKDIATDQASPKLNQIARLRAEAFSALKKPDEAYQALSLLPQDKSVLQQRVEIARNNERWQDAADSIELIVQQEDLSPTRPISPEQADLLLSWAVALYLADNREVLANLRDRYSDTMLQTAKAKQFDVITRPRQTAMLSDRDTINQIISEIDMFKGFMQSYRETQIAPEQKQPVAAPQTAEAKVEEPPNATKTTKSETPVTN